MKFIKNININIAKNIKVQYSKILFYFRLIKVLVTRITKSTISIKLRKLIPKKSPRVPPTLDIKSIRAVFCNCVNRL